MGLCASQLQTYHRNGLNYSQNLLNDSVGNALSQYWNSVSSLSSDPTQLHHSGFKGGLMGFASYDLAAQQSVHLQQTQSPTALFGDYDIFFQQVNQSEYSDHDSGWALYGPDDSALQVIYRHIQQLFEYADLNQSNIPSLSVCQTFKPVWSFEQYSQAFDHIQDYLQAGDCYQVNLTQAFKAKIQGSLLGAVNALNQLTHASYAGYTRFADFELLSCSPELFLQFSANGEMITRPIKGTRPRSADLLKDNELKLALSTSEKDRSENLMIVDLLRNDLGIYARTGSVHVPVLFEIESFAQVHHLVSEVRAMLKPDISPINMLFTVLPGGSITGAPKIRAMQIIDELEAESRGAYCGSMGYLNYDGSGSFNILIRTLQQRGDTVTAWAGGGITVASKCDEEYQECMDKIGAILDCINQFKSDC